MKSATVLVLSAILLVGASETAYCDTFIFSNTCDDGNWFSICAYTGECPPEQQCDTNNWGILGIGSQPAFPGPLDDVILGDFFVTLDSDITLNSLLLPSAAVLRWTDGDLFAGAQVSGPFGINGLLLVDSVNGVRVLMPTQVSGAIHVAGGTLTFSGDLNSGVSASYAIDTDSTLSLAGATVRGAISGNIEGTITNDGNMTIGSQGATFNITGAGFRFGTGTLTINAGGALTNDGIIAGVSNFGFSASALGGDGNLENHGTIDFQLGRWNSASGSTASIVNTNTGVVTKTTGNSAEVNVPFINSGSLNVQLGDLNIGGVFSSDANGVISVDAQGSLSLEGATLSGTFNGSASGDFTNGGNMTIGSQGATFNITGAGFRFGTGT
ncbi:MAG TPA: hypothetical protein P5081_06220, partial [Phycisphaerae bacterium]|nr:hypothetical protein [Phycisphaerae bacterium]